MKSASKRKLGEIRKSQRKTGGGSGDEDDGPIDTSAERIVSVAGGESLVVGLDEVDEFGSSNNESGRGNVINESAISLNVHS